MRFISILLSSVFLCSFLFFFTVSVNATDQESSFDYETCFFNGANGLLEFHNNLTQTFEPNCGWWNSAVSYHTLSEAAVHVLSKSSSSSSQKAATFKAFKNLNKKSFKNNNNKKDFAVQILSLLRKMHLVFDLVQIFHEGSHDDSLWWCLCWLSGSNLAKQLGDTSTSKDFMETAKQVWEYILKNSWTEKCAGGVWWSSRNRYKNSITNELFMSVASRIALQFNEDEKEQQQQQQQQEYHQQHRANNIKALKNIRSVNNNIRNKNKNIKTSSSSSNNKTYYQDWAKKEYDWFLNSSLVDSRLLINDGLNSANCRNNGGTVWTYNQGVILGAQSNLFLLTNDTKYLDKAYELVNASLRYFTDKDSGEVIVESCEHTNSCNGDQCQFKGIFMRNILQLTRLLAPSSSSSSLPKKLSSMKEFLTETIQRNAKAVCTRSVLKEGGIQEKWFFGLNWNGPFRGAKSACKTTSALDVILAAMILS